MASIWTISSPSLLCNYSLSTRKSASCKKKLYSPRTKHTPRSKLEPRSKLTDDITMETIVRRSANYQPSLWSYDFFQSLSSKYTGEKYMERLQTLKEEVRTMIHQENQMQENPLSVLKLVDDLQRLGISYHFVNEISNVLENVYSNNYKSHEKWTNMDLNLKSLGFRLLRQHGYHIPKEIFNDVIDENGNFKGNLYKDIFGMLNLYEASFFSLEAENILDAARELTTIYMKESLENIVDQSLASLIGHALAFPQHWMVPRVEAKWFIEAYERKSDMNPTMLELAKLDFNMVQAIHQDDLKQASSWWKKTCWEKFGFGRDRLAENFMWSVAENYLPNFQGRVPLTKVIAMITTIDDVYDVYGTFQELKQFTDIVNSWNVNAIEELPDYMKICFLELYNSTNETSYNILTNKGVFVLPYLKKAWQDLCNSYIIEAQWYKDGCTPTFNEFINNASMSIGMSTIIRHDYWFTLTSTTEEAFDQRMERAENMIRNASLIVRLMNDMGTSSDELERGDVPKSIQCYMHESGATEVEARAYIKQLIIETWKKLNKERQEIGSEFPPEFVESIINLARMGHFMYTNGDKHGKPEIFKPYVLSIFVNPI